MKLIQRLFFLLIFLFPGQCLVAQSITLVTLGDSLTIGDGDEEGSNLGGYPPRLLSALQADYPGSTLNNVAASGLTSNDLINIELTPAMNTFKAAAGVDLKIALVWIGSNDLFGLYNNVCDEYYPGNYTLCEQDELNNFQANINKIITDLKTTGASVYIALLDDQSRRPVMTNEILRNEIFPNITSSEVTRMSAQVMKYNNAILNLANSLDVTTVDFYNTTLFEDQNTLSSDGNHPNSTAYDIIAGLWYAKIKEALSTSTTTPIVTSNPQPDIKVDNADTITVNKNHNVAVSLGMNSGSFSATNADWWIIVLTPSGKIQSYAYPEQWITMSNSINSLHSLYQGPLFNFPATVLFHFSAIESGQYQLLFAIDQTMNNTLDVDTLAYDSAIIQVK
jgi:lysophospholipase L1-like esterase